MNLLGLIARLGGLGGVGPRQVVGITAEN